MAIFAAHSRWVHLSTNTLPFYNVMPRLQNQFPTQITTWAPELEGNDAHWMHEHASAQPRILESRISRWLRSQDGVHVLLADRTEVGNYFVQDRGLCPQAGSGGEYVPEHVHHNYKHTDAYELSRQKRGKEAAAPGQFLATGEWSRA